MRFSQLQSRRLRGFTLLELIVVVGIIIILISILIPSLMGSRMQAQISDTKAHLSQLSTACAQYNELFQAYPGPVTEGGVVTAAGNYSGNQNLLIGLGRRWSTTNATFGSTAYVTLTDAKVNGSSILVDDTGSLSPLDWSRNGAAGVPYDALTFKPKDFHPEVKVAGFPVLVDHFKEAMPLLYFRKIPGRTNMTAGDPSAAFYQDANVAFMDHDSNVAVTSSIKTSYSQKQIVDPYEGSATVNIYQQMLGNNVGGTWVPKGGYVIVSAGPDHLYGTKDDIIVAGGN